MKRIVQCNLVVQGGLVGVCLDASVLAAWCWFAAYSSTAIQRTLGRLQDLGSIMDIH